MVSHLLLKRPTEYLCPFCGKLHTWEKEVFEQSSTILVFESSCSVVKYLFSKGALFGKGRFFYYIIDNRFYFTIEKWCGNLRDSISGSLDFSEFQFDKKRNLFYYSIPTKCEFILDSKSCHEYCLLGSCCSIFKNISKKDYTSTMITFGFKFSDI